MTQDQTIEAPALDSGELDPSLIGGPVDPCGQDD